MADRDYTINSQIVGRFTFNSRVLDGIEVHYRGPGGIEGYVRVPVDTATPDLVDALIRAQLDTQLAIAQLGSAG